MTPWTSILLSMDFYNAFCLELFSQDIELFPWTHKSWTFLLDNWTFSLDTLFLFLDTTEFFSGHVGPFPWTTYTFAWTSWIFSLNTIDRFFPGGTINTYNTRTTMENAHRSREKIHDVHYSKTCVRQPPLKLTLLVDEERWLFYKGTCQQNYMTCTFIRQTTFFTSTTI